MLSWEDIKNIVCDMYLKSYFTKEILEKFGLSYGDLTKILNEKGIPLRCKNYNGNWLYCPKCGKRIFKTRAIEKKGKQLRSYLCPFCGRRLRTKPKHKGRKSTLETEARVNGLRREVEGKI